MYYNKVEISGVNTSKLETLTSEEKQDLLEKAKNGDDTARQRLIDGNLRLVLSIVQRFSGRSDSADDLFQVGCIGLIKAIDNFNTELDVKFSTYAVYYIIGAMKDELKKFRLIKNKDEVILKEDLNDVKSNYLNLEKFDFTDSEKEILMLRLSYGYTQKEIADELKISQSTVSRMFKSLKNKILLNKNTI